MNFEVLTEGESDVPVVREVLSRRFGLLEGGDFRIHPHRGKGRLPVNAMARPDPANRTLLHQLPAKLRGYAHLDRTYCVLVLVDADNDDCRELKRSLVNVYKALDRKPPKVLFRIAVEETESWLIADVDAVKAAYPKLDRRKLERIAPDSVVGAWERLAEALGSRRGVQRGSKRAQYSGSDKAEWARQIAPHLNLNQPSSPSLTALVSGIDKLIK